MPLTLEEFTYGFVNTFTPEDAKAAYEKYAVPESGRIFYEGGFANFHLHSPTEIDWKNGDRAPLLFVGAEKDHTVPASVTKAEFTKASKSPVAHRLPRVRGPSPPSDGRPGLGGDRRGH